MSDKEIKVTDKRIFTPDGELREDFRDLEGEAERDPAAEPSPEPAAESAPPSPGSGESIRQPPPTGAGADSGRPDLEMPGASRGPGSPGFLDLVSVLAQPIAVYLGDAKLPDGQSMEDLEAARLYIDLLDVLREKTVGNLSSEESRVLEDLLYQLRLRYVSKRG